MVCILFKGIARLEYKYPVPVTLISFLAEFAVLFERPTPFQLFECCDVRCSWIIEGAYIMPVAGVCMAAMCAGLFNVFGRRRERKRERK